MLSAEQQLLGSLRTDPAAGNESLDSLLNRAEMRTLTDLAGQEGLAPLLYALLSNAGMLGALPDELRADLDGLYHRTAALNMRRSQHLSDLLEGLEPTGVNVVVLKGMALLDSLYGDPGLRPTGDIDLWVAEEQLATLLEVLGESGYEAEPYYPDTYRLGTTTVDLHTHLLGAERVRLRELIFAAGQRPMFDDAVPTTFGGSVATKLGPSQELLLLGLHLLKHNAERLLWLIEINELVERCTDAEWNRLMELAIRMRQERSVHQVAFLANLLLPDAAARRYRQLASETALGRRDRRVLTRRATKGSLPLWAPLVFFSSQSGAWNRVASTFETLFPRPPILRQIFRDDHTSLWRLYVRRFGHLVAWVIRV